MQFHGLCSAVSEFFRKIVFTLLIALIAGGGVFSATTASAARMALQTPQAAALKIIVIAGEDSVNIVQQRTAVAPVVEVRDQNNQPVAGAVVTFSIRGNAAFSGGLNTVSITTNAAGRAAVAGLTPTGSGAVQINVAAAFQGQTASATVAQANFATAAQAASAGTGTSGGTSGAASGSGGGLGPGAITGLVTAAGAAAGGLYAYREYQKGDPPEVESIVASPPAGLQGETSFRIGLNGGGFSSKVETSIKYEFGDGEVETLRFASFEQFVTATKARHAYGSAGSFTIKVTVTDKYERSSQGQTTVLVKSITGRWLVGTTGNYFDLSQSGSTIVGTYTAANGQGSGNLVGRVQPNDDSNQGGLFLAVSPTGGGLPIGFRGGGNSPDEMSGVLTIGTTATLINLRRQ